MKKAKINFIIDGFLVVSTVFIISIGFLIKYTLLTGKDSMAVYGKKMEMNFLGMDRHQWGDIHLYAGFIFILLLVLHLYFHWDAIKCLYKRYIGTGLLANFSAILFTILMLFLLYLPFAIEPELNEYKTKPNYSELNKENSHSSHVDTKSGKKDEEIRGSMTLNELLTSYNLDKKEFLKKMEIDGEINGNTNLGRLRRAHNFDIEKVREIVKSMKSKGL